MKINKAILATMLGFSLANLSHAGTVYMTGSTAMRGTVYSALTNAGAVFSSAPQVTLYTGGTTGNNAGNGATYMAFVGTLVGGSGTTTIQCDWSGSEAGYSDIVSNRSENFIGVTLDGQDHGTNIPSSFISAAVDLAMADNAQSFSRSKTPSITKSAEVGVITFEWVRNPGLWTGTNVTDSQIRQALSGSCVRAVFDGNSNSINDYVYVSGRDNQSGTRVNAFGDTLFGILTPPQQIEMNSSGVMQQVGGSYQGDFGYSGGGGLAATLGATTTSATDSTPNGGTGYSVIAYLSVGDAATAIGNGAVLLSYNGVPFSSAAVKEGTYTFWGNEYINQKNGDSSNTDANTAYTRLSASTGIPTFCDGTKAISLSAMHTTRTGPTSDPSHL